MPREGGRRVSTTCRGGKRKTNKFEYVKTLESRQSTNKE